MNDQFDRVVPVVAGDAHLVDHTLYKEQSPSSGRLHTFQFRLQIRRIPALGRWRPTTPIGYAHHEVLILDEDHYLYGHLRSVLVAVFHGVHRRLGHGGLEPLQVLPANVEVPDRLGDRLHGQPFVSGFAWHGKLGQGSPEFGVRPRGIGVGHAVSDLSRVTRVMSSSCSHSSPVKRESSERRKLTIACPPERCPATSPCKRGKPNISRSGSWASTRPSL